EDYVEMIDFTYLSTVFDENIEYKDADEDVDINSSTSHCKIHINISQNCVNLIL
ncbi:11761_t:CDS:1, partial [Dentiscutata heterogama]